MFKVCNDPVHVAEKQEINQPHKALLHGKWRKVGLRGVPGCQPSGAAEAWQWTPVGSRWARRR